MASNAPLIAARRSAVSDPKRPGALMRTSASALGGERGASGVPDGELGGELPSPVAAPRWHDGEVANWLRLEQPDLA